MDCHLYFHLAFGPFHTTPYFSDAPSLWGIPSDSPAQNQQGTLRPTIAAGGFTRKNASASYHPDRDASSEYWHQ